MSDYEKNESNKRPPNKRMKKIVMLIAASLAGVSTTAIASTLIAYDAMFARYERPDYALTPGLYCYERIEASLYRETMSVLSGEVDLAA